jgi:hypothetical protein
MNIPIAKKNPKHFSEECYHLFWLDLGLVILTWSSIIFSIGTKSLFGLAVVIPLYLLMIFQTLFTPTFRYILNMQSVDNLSDHINKLKAKRP